MNTIKKIIYLITIILLISCGFINKIIYYDAGTMDDGDIWDSDITDFFYNKKRHMEIHKYSYKLNLEIKRIVEIVKNQENQEINETFYEYAFITNNKDTIYTNSYFEIWRYKDKKIKISNKVKEYLKHKNK
jgi:hypothetical protein